MLRSTSKINDNNELKEQLNLQIKNEFKSKKDLSDPVAIKSLLTEGYRNLKKLEELGPIKAYSSDSWINIQDEEDKRGRVGEGWPWDKN